jgi:predicted MPP superfamily phosphohydrolase
MRPDLYRLLTIALAIPPALGHFYHFVLLINVGSGLGFRESLMDRVRGSLFVLLGGSACFLTWLHLRTPWWTWPWPLLGYALLCAASGMFIAPLACLSLARRPRPEGLTGSFEAHDLDGRTGKEALIGSGGRSWLLRLPRNESFRLSVHEWAIAIPGLPESLSGLRIVQLSDLHCAPCFARLFFEAVVDQCADVDADLVVLTGDVVEDDEVIPWIEPVLGRLDARLGKFAIFGNHDYEHNPHEIQQALERAGFAVLNGRWTTIDAPGATLALGGTSAPWGRALDWNGMPAADFRLLLSHTPDLFYAASERRIDLMLAGHNHGGQIRFPLVGPIFMPSRYSRRFDRGFFKEKRTLLYVNAGVGGKHPVRYGCPPEVARFVLRAGFAAGRFPEAERRDAIEHGQRALEQGRV